MQAHSIPKSPTRPQVRLDVDKPIVTRNGKVLSLLIALEALRQQSYALDAHKV